jgi:hypothetical protein
MFMNEVGAVYPNMIRDLMLPTALARAMMNER